MPKNLFLCVLCLTCIYASDTAQAAWTKLSDTSRPIESVTAVATDPPTLYALTEANAEGTSTIEVSTNGGESWKIVGEAPGIWSNFFVHPSQPNTLFANERNSILYESLDGGVSWNRAPLVDVNLPSINQWVQGTVVRSNDPRGVYVFTWNRGIFRRSATGDSWEQISPHTEEGPPQGVGLKQNSDSIYVGTTNGIYLFSPDSDPVSLGDGGPGDSRVTEVLVDHFDDQILFVDTFSGSWLTNDGGASWSEVAHPGRLVFDDAQAGRAFGLTQGVVRESTDGLQTWRPVDTTGLNGTPVSLQIINGTLLARTSEGLFKSKPARANSGGLVAAVLPSSRSVVVGNTATAFATVINVGDESLTGCRITPKSTMPGDFSFQPTDPETNAPSGERDQPVILAPNQAQSFVMSFTPSAETEPTAMQFGFDCNAVAQATIFEGLNTLLLSASDNPTADIVALTATASADGIVSIPAGQSAGAFSMASVNVGISENLTVSVDTGDAQLPLVFKVCATDETTAQCLNAPGETVSGNLGALETQTYSVFVDVTGPVAFDPAAHRIYVRFSDVDGTIRGSSSVAIRTNEAP